MRTTLIASGLAALAATTFALPATAAESGEHAAFYSGTRLSGTKAPVDLTSHQCVNLAQPARSAINISNVAIDVFYNSDCRPGLPGQTGNTHFILDSLGQANFSLPALSYRVK